MPIELTELRKVGEWLLGTMNSIHGAIEYFGLDIDSSDLEDRLLDINVECCYGCGWWHESGEFVETGAGGYLCSDCATSMKTDPFDDGVWW
jgi:hypothetical protein